jgi:hypothetical protein
MAIRKSVLPFLGTIAGEWTTSSPVNGLSGRRATGGVSGCVDDRRWQGSGDASIAERAQASRSAGELLHAGEILDHANHQLRTPIRGSGCVDPLEWATWEIEGGKVVTS